MGKVSIKSYIWKARNKFFWLRLIEDLGKFTLYYGKLGYVGEKGL